MYSYKKEDIIGLSLSIQNLKIKKNCGIILIDKNVLQTFKTIALFSFEKTFASLKNQ